MNKIIQVEINEIIQIEILTKLYRQKFERNHTGRKLNEIIQVEIKRNHTGRN